MNYSPNCMALRRLAATGSSSIDRKNQRTGRMRDQGLILRSRAVKGHRILHSSGVDHN